jgi:hypothetical protein
MAAASAVHARRRRRLVLPLLLLLLPVVRARVTALIVFGDSTVDAGNNNAVPTAVRSNFPPYGRDFPGGRATGRFSNGRVATDFYSEALGLGRGFVPAYLDPDYGIQDFAIGVCFASAGSGLDVATSRVFVSTPTISLSDDRAVLCFLSACATSISCLRTSAFAGVVSFWPLQKLLSVFLLGIESFCMLRLTYVRVYI